MTRSLLLLAAAATFAGCSTDIDINAPYKDNTVVYGLLNMRDSVQIMRINKAFLGEGNALVYAQIPDSNQYSNEDITRAMVFRRTNGQRVDSFPLRDTLMPVREPGVFFYPDQKLYYFTENNVWIRPENGVPTAFHLEQNSVYELELDIKGRRIASSAPIVNDFLLGNSLLQQPSVRFYSQASGYLNPEYKWNTGLNGKRYVLSYRFNFKEVRGNDTIPKAVEQIIGKAVAPNSQSTVVLSVTMDGQLFYSNLANAIPADPTVTKRIFTGLDFLFAVANDNFHTYLTLTEPISGIVEDRPQFSNLEGAYGIFASRYNKNLIGKRLDDASLNELINGQYTGNLNFCSAFNAGPPYGCD
jgi:hypothetical protein